MTFQGADHLVIFEVGHNRPDLLNGQLAFRRGAFSHKHSSLLERKNNKAVTVLIPFLSDGSGCGVRGPLPAEFDTISFSTIGAGVLAQ